MPVAMSHSFGAAQLDGSGSAYQAEVLADSPVAYWRLGESSGTNAASEVNSPTLDGTYEGDYTLAATGAVSDGNTAVTLGGAGTGRISSVHDALVDITSDLTVECWAKFSTSQNNNPIVAKWGSTNPTKAYLLSVFSGGSNIVGFSIHNGTSSFFADTGSTQMNDGMWHHYVGVFDDTANTVTFYVDGAQVDQVTSVTTQPQSVSSIVRIGNYSSSTSSGFQGDVDEVAIYNTALSLARIQAHYNAA